MNSSLKVKNCQARTSLAAGISLMISSGAYAAGTSSLMEEVLVTAEKREESVQDLSASITAIGPEMMMRAGIEDMTRLEHIVPGLRVGLSGNEARPAMRGTRTNNVGTEAEQVVGIFHDGVYVPTTTQALGAYVDIARIEVLRGPQGTLYGRNTFGGTINVISNEPDFDGVSGNIQGLYGDYDRTKFQGVLNIPVGDALAFRIAGLSDKHDGYIENTVDPGTSDDLDNQDTQYWRLSAKWLISDSMDLLVRYSKSEKDSNNTAIWGYQQIGAWIDGRYVVGHHFAPEGASEDQGPWKVGRNFPSAAVLDDESITVNFTADLGFATGRVIFNQTEFDGEQLSDFDYSDAGPTIDNTGDWSFLGWNSSQDTDSLELQLLSNGEGPLQWMVGYYQYEQDAKWGWISIFDGVLTPYGYGVTDYQSESEAYFANGAYSLTENFRILAGVRFNEDTKGTQSGDESWDDTLWKAGIEYDVNEDLMVYATASTGFRAGGFNGTAVAEAIFNATGRDISSYDPEQVEAFEIGMKSTLLDGRMVLNVAAYNNEYTDMQAQSFFTVPGDTATSEYTENGGSVDAKGLEVELQWTPTDNWYISANMAMMDAEFGDYLIAALNGLGDLGGHQDDIALNLNGWEPANAPELTVGLQISYDFSLGDAGILTPMVQTTYTSDYFSSDINIRGTEQDAHTKSDVRLTWRNPANTITVEAFVLNIEDEAVLNRTVPFNPAARPEIASIQANWSRPRTWGLSVGYEF